MRQDFAYALRELRKQPGLVATAVLSLTLGIGATTAVFSVIYGLLVNPYPYQGASRMVELNVVDQSGRNRYLGVTGAELAALRQTHCIEAAAASWGTWNLTTTDEDLPEDVPSTQLSGNAGIYFGVPALLGRTILPADAPEGEDPQPVVVLSFKFWQRHYNSDPGVIGRRLQLVHKNYTIVGVMPSRFTINDADVYLPLKITTDPGKRFTPRLRLRPGITHEAANAELQPLIDQFAKADPSHFPKTFRVHVRGIIERYVEHLGRSLALLFGAVGLLLIIGCANVSILLLARGTARQHELAVRNAIGASRWRIQRQLLVESLVLSLTGAIGGVILAFRLLPLLVRWLPEFSFPHEVVIHLSLPVLAFAVGLSLLTGILFGLAPAIGLSRPELVQLMQSGSRRTTSGGHARLVHHALVTGQIALTLVLLTSAAAAMNGFLHLVRADLGYDPHNTMSVGIPVHQNAHVNWEDRSNFFRRLLKQVQTVPEVVAAGISSNATPPANGWNQSFELFGRSSVQHQQALLNFVSSEYFPVLHIPVLQGRLWDDAEIQRGSGLAVVNQTFARQNFPAGDALGKQVRVPGMVPDPPFVQVAKDANAWMQIIGVVADARDDGLRDPIKPAIFVPYTDYMSVFTQILVRTRTSPLAALNRVRAAVKTIDPEQQVVGQVQDLQQWIERTDEYSYGRLVAAIFAGFSIVALALAAIGLFSVVSYGVAQRTNEFGIRMALGATSGTVLKLVMLSTARNVIGGVAIGVALSLLGGRILSSWAEASAQNPLVFAAVTLLLVTTSALATLIPARRVSAVDPMVALRYE